MSTIDLATLRVLTTLARESVVARERGTPPDDGLDLDTCEDALAAAELVLERARQPDRAERLETALADCYDILHRLRHGYRENELPLNASRVEVEARELLGIRERLVEALD